MVVGPKHSWLMAVDYCIDRMIHWILDLRRKTKKTALGIFFPDSSHCTWLSLPTAPFWFPPPSRMLFIPHPFSNLLEIQWCWSGEWNCSLVTPWWPQSPAPRYVRWIPHSIFSTLVCGSLGCSILYSHLLELIFSRCLDSLASLVL